MAADPFARTKEVINARLARAHPVKIVLKVNLTTSYGEKLFVSGNIKPLGNDNPARARRMDFDEGAWRTTFEVDREISKIEYRYKIIHDATKNERWEKSATRTLEIPHDKSGIWEVEDLVVF